MGNRLTWMDLVMRSDAGRANPDVARKLIEKATEKAGGTPLSKNGALPGISSSVEVPPAPFDKSS
jgi:hypothetical protein